MGYLHIDNLYKSQDILLFRRCYALEKIHGTSAHVRWDGHVLHYFPGGGSPAMFIALFDAEQLAAAFLTLGFTDATVYGEFYGGSHQGMKHVYGEKQRFVAFDVAVGDVWLSVPNMQDVCTALGLPVVPWNEIATDLADIDAQRDLPSAQSLLNGVAGPQPRDGIVLRPLIEVTKNNGERIIAKHKRDDFGERATPQKIVDPEKLKVLASASAIADEWVTPMRLSHVLDKMPADTHIEQMRDVIAAMVEDVKRESSGEVTWSKDAATAIGRKTAMLFKERLQQALRRTP